MKEFLESMIVAALGGAFPAAVTALSAKPFSWAAVGGAAAAGAIVSVAALWRERPGPARPCAPGELPKP